MKGALGFGVPLFFSPGNEQADNTSFSLWAVFFNPA